MALDLDVFYNRPYTLNETVNFRAGSPEELESIQNLLEGFQTLELDEEDPVTGVGFKGNDHHLEGDGTNLDENGIIDPFVLLDLIISSKWHSVKSRYEDVRQHVIPTTPIYNPLGNGDKNSEFNETDNKSYEKMMNEKHKKNFWKNIK